MQSLTEQLEPICPPQLRARGEALHEEGSVRIEQLDGRMIRATVDGGRPYQLQIRHERGLVIDLVCDCPHQALVCKHLWGLALAVEAHPRFMDARERKKAPADPERLTDELLLCLDAGRETDRPTETITHELRLAIDVAESDFRDEWMLEARAHPRDEIEKDAPVRLSRADRLLLTELAEKPPSLEGSARPHLPVATSRAAALLRRLAIQKKLDLLTDEDPRPVTWAGEEPARQVLATEEQPDGALVLTQHVVLPGEDRRAPDSVRFHRGGIALLDDDRLISLDHPHGPTLTRMFRERPRLRVPPNRVSDLVARTGGVLNGVRVTMPEGWTEVERPDGLRIEITDLDDLPVQGKVRVRLAARYADVLAPLPPRSSGPITQGRTVVHRDAESERTLEERFLVLGGQMVRRGTPEEECRIPVKNLADTLERFLGDGHEVWIEGKPVRRRGTPSISVKSGIDWFTIDGGLKFDDELELPIPQIWQHRRSGERWVRLEDGSIGLLPDRFLDRLDLLSPKIDDEDGELRLAKTQALLLEGLVGAEGTLESDELFDHWMGRLREGAHPSPLEESERFGGDLRPYQREGLGWLAHLRDLAMGGCLADDMGLGKTIQMLAHLDHVHHAIPEDERRPSLVVCPRSLLFNWSSEARRFTPHLKIHTHWGGERDREGRLDDRGDVILTTYSTLRLDIDLFLAHDFELVVLDEAQAIKNRSSQAARAAWQLRARQRVALTGTPVENHLGELWSLSEFLNPGLLGRSTAFTRAVRTRAAEWNRALGQALAPLFLRRRKEQVAQDLPPKTEQVIWCDLGEDERAEYRELASFLQGKIGQGARAKGLGSMKIEILEALLRLRQLACHPGLVDPLRRNEPSPKIEMLVERLREIEEAGHKALVFSQFTRLLAIVRDRLEAEDLTYEYLDGKTRQREERVQRFQEDPDVPVFLISLKAGGTGLNLTAADYVFVLDPWWNPAVEAQAIDRAHRIGQTRPVSAYRLITRETVEERVLALQDTKRQLSEDLFGEEGSVLRAMTPEDLDLLLS